MWHKNVAGAKADPMCPLGITICIEQRRQRREADPEAERDAAMKREDELARKREAAQQKRLDSEQVFSTL